MVYLSLTVVVLYKCTIKTMVCGGLGGLSVTDCCYVVQMHYKDHGLWRSRWSICH